jgi:hypothetical protein
MKNPRTLREASLQEKLAAEHAAAQTNGPKGVHVDFFDDDDEIASHDGAKKADEGQNPAGAAKPGNDSGDARKELVLPTGNIEYQDTAKALFPVLAKKHRYFIHGGLVAELSPGVLLRDKQPHVALQPLDPDALRSRIEEDFRVLSWRRDPKDKEKSALFPTRCPRDTAVVLLKSDYASQFLPPLHTLSACPVLAGEVGKAKILSPGYHAINGGIYVQGGNVILPHSVKEACQTITELVRDYHFITPSDKSRAVAHFLSPALRAGRLLDEADFPLDLSEANVSQSGKTLRLKLTYTAYDEQPYLIACREGGVGSIDESISSALIAAKPFITIDNYRGHLGSQILESCLRGTGVIGARIPHRGEVQVPTGHINWQLSSNGVVGALDFANRCIITRIQKQPPDYKFHDWPEGSILAHTKAKQPKILGAILYLIMQWDQKGRPGTKENRHDFTEWCRALDWMIGEYFELEPLLDGHTEEILRISNPNLSWLRQVAHAVNDKAKLDSGLPAWEIADLCVNSGIELGSDRLTPDQQSMLAGRKLNSIFSEKNEISVERYNVKRETRTQYDHTNQRNIEKHYYWFEIRP